MVCLPQCHFIVATTVYSTTQDICQIFIEKLAFSFAILHIFSAFSIWNHLVQITKDGNKTVIITTHYIEEARQAHTVSK